MKNKLKLETYELSAEIERIGNSAVKEAQERNRRDGIPNVYSLNGKIIFELPNGEITTKNPFPQQSRQDLSSDE